MIRSPPENVLKSIIGKYLVWSRITKYCHVDSIRGHDTQNKIVTADIDLLTVTETGIRQTVECRYDVDDFGIYYVYAHNIIKEDIQS